MHTLLIQKKDRHDFHCKSIFVRRVAALALAHMCAPPGAHPAL